MAASRSLVLPAIDLPELGRGEVWLVGAGPGAPGLLTLEALNAIQQADVIVHDALIDPRVLALAKPTARFEAVGKRGGRPSADQDDISERLVVLARNGERVVRLKGGDPFVFGRGGEEVLTLAQNDVAFRVLPGLTAGLAGLTAFSIPATMRGLNQAIILATGHLGAEGGLDWPALARTGQPLVIYMAVRTIAPITEALRAGGLAPETATAIISAATTPAASILVSTLAEIADAAEAAAVAAPALLVVGSIVSFRDTLDQLATTLQTEADA
ncbi:uroporphyrinogen-III C-methyltransferase [Kaistia dalseonensis]|uniref:uroporphyrinogen-III C-methyltransferase n=1 Tax=Kaistia dalseonensis TaxID=410840 RepID=A0ABU0HAE6_9HYPH|nr:uroporphyrinogen-III C-methyltransferase [Kaistia dalseonensis]MCX5496656.1 uroporphyrinogen-III C-methyltransferase [Kaistia dalseonensis]MDQ0439279.1 uroporphyrin-III C-methyltransferase [Kaistia dalseonensis]